MTRTLTFDLLLIGQALDDVHAMKRVEITCMYGKPAMAPQSLNDIPFTVKDVCIDGKIQDFYIKRFILEALGGDDAVKDYVLMNIESGVA
jgi:hypothetical protein